MRRSGCVRRGHGSHNGMSLQKALAALQHALFPDDECEGAVAHVAAGQGPAASAASCTPDGAELCGALHGVTQVSTPWLARGMHGGCLIRQTVASVGSG